MPITKRCSIHGINVIDFCPVCFTEAYEGRFDDQRIGAIPLSKPKVNEWNGVTTHPSDAMPARALKRG